MQRCLTRICNMYVSNYMQSSLGGGAALHAALLDPRPTRSTRSLTAAPRPLAPTRLHCQAPQGVL